MCNLRPKRSNADLHLITALVSYLHISQQRYNTTESHIGQTAPAVFLMEFDARLRVQIKKL